MVRRVEKVLFALGSNASGFCILFRIHLNHHACQDLVWCIAISEFGVCTFISCLGLSCTGTSGTVSDDSRVFGVKKRILVSCPLSLRGHIEQYSVFQLLRIAAIIRTSNLLLEAVFGRLIEVVASRHGIITILVWGQ